MYEKNIQVNFCVSKYPCFNNTVLKWKAIRHTEKMNSAFLHVFQRMAHGSNQFHSIKFSNLWSCWNNGGYRFLLALSWHNNHWEVDIIAQSGVINNLQICNKTFVYLIFSIQPVFILLYYTGIWFSEFGLGISWLFPLFYKANVQHSF